MNICSSLLTKRLLYSFFFSSVIFKSSSTFIYLLFGLKIILEGAEIKEPSVDLEPEDNTGVKEPSVGVNEILEDGVKAFKETEGAKDFNSLS